jgi:uncharacterized protein (TIGR02145 family)
MKRLTTIIIMLMVSLTIFAQVETVKIGDQEWMAKNLNVGIMIPGNQAQTNNGIVEKYCYNNLESNCNVYGGLYSWNELIAYNVTKDAYGICPSGFRIPTKEDYRVLNAYCGGTLLPDGRSSQSENVGRILQEIGYEHWYQRVVDPSFDGLDLYGFKALPSGYKYNTFFYNIKQSTLFWTSTTGESPTYTWVRSIAYQNKYFGEYLVYNTGPYASYLPARCIKK